MAEATKPAEAAKGQKPQLRWKDGKEYVQLVGCGSHSNKELNDPEIGANIVKIAKKRGVYNDFIEEAKA